MIADGDEVYVEYGPGPKAFSTRWEGRADTPEFNWGDDGVVQARPAPKLHMQRPCRMACRAVRGLDSLGER